MVVSLRPPPQISGDAEQQMVQLQGYLFSLQRDLNIAFTQLSGDKIAQQVIDLVAANPDTALASASEMVDKYVSLKALVVKTADTVYQQMDTLIETFEGQYVANSTFGTYQEEVIQTITTTATAIVQSFNYLSETIFNETMELQRVESEQYIKSGLLYYDGAIPRYGLAIGENMTSIINEDGERVITKENVSITVTANRINFWQNNAVVAYFESNKLYVNDAQILSKLTLGPWEVTHTKGYAIKWAGGE